MDSAHGDPWLSMAMFFFTNNRVCLDRFQRLSSFKKFTPARLRFLQILLKMSKMISCRWLPRINMLNLRIRDARTDLRVRRSIETPEPTCGFGVRFKKTSIKYVWTPSVVHAAQRDIEPATRGGRGGLELQRDIYVYEDVYMFMNISLCKKMNIC